MDLVLETDALLDEFYQEFYFLSMEYEGTDLYRTRSFLIMHYHW
jgi:hypothetical protein